MKTTTIKFPIEYAGEDYGNLKNRVLDFIANEMVDGALCLDVQQYLNLNITETDYVETWVMDEVPFYIYDVRIEADDHSIDIIEEWQKEFKMELH
jgi:hypothetical protein